MKKLFTVLTITGVFAACNNKNDENLQTNRVMLTDTTSIYDNSSSSDTGTALQRGERISTATTPRESLNYKSDSKTSSETYERNATSSTSKHAAKKGWSNRAKGAVIGGAAGAVGGAIISKHKGKGAIIGGLAGAAGGYIIGNEKDKKTGR